MRLLRRYGTYTDHEIFSRHCMPRASASGEER
jgi:hypothetical protein